MAAAANKFRIDFILGCLSPHNSAFMIRKVNFFDKIFKLAHLFGKFKSQENS